MRNVPLFLLLIFVKLAVLYYIKVTVHVGRDQIIEIEIFTEYKYKKVFFFWK